ncbi:hypothetical protein BH23PLA1_BH23PLA1_17790 [soil metagenome]
MVFLTLIRRQLRDSRWSIALASLAFFGLSILTAWRISVVQQGEGIGPRGMGFFRVLGGSSWDGSTLALQVAWWNHPIVVLTVLGWGITRAASAVSGEIERGTLDLTLSRPVSRWSYLGAQIVATILILLMLVLALIAGNLISTLVFRLEDPPGLRAFLWPGAMVLALGLSVFGYTLPLSAADVIRRRPSIIAMAVTLGGLVALSIAAQFEDYQEILERLSVFACYAPVTAAIEPGEDIAFNLGVLAGVFALGCAAAFVAFLRRDLPTSAG